MEDKVLSREKALDIEIFASPITGGEGGTLQGKNLLPLGSKFFSLRVILVDSEWFQI